MSDALDVDRRAGRHDQYDRLEKRLEAVEGVMREFVGAYKAFRLFALAVPVVVGLMTVATLMK